MKTAKPQAVRTAPATVAEGHAHSPTRQGPDVMAVIGLHIQACQALQRCAAELATPALTYVEACRHVDNAADLLHALRSIELSSRASGATE